MFVLRKTLLLISCLQICSCSQSQKSALSIGYVLDDYNNENLNIVENGCDIVPYYCYTVGLSIDKSYLKGDQLADILDNVKIKYDKNDITLINPTSFEVVEDNYVLPFKITAAKSFNLSQIEFTCFKQTIKFSFKTIEKKYSIGTSVINDGECNDIEKYLASLRYYTFEEKERLASVNKELYQVFNTSAYIKDQRTILIKTSEVERFLFDSIYLPENIDKQSAVTYNGRLFDFDDPSENDTDYALFNSKNTGRYQLALFNAPGEMFDFFCVNDRNSLLKNGFFNANKESFCLLKINDIEFYLWKKGQVYVPSYYLATGEDINIFFSKGNYSYIISKKASISME